MKINETSRTAQYMALFRALESTRKQNERLFNDPFAIHFLDRGLKLAVSASRISLFRNYVEKTIQKKTPGALSSGVARTKYIDDLLYATISNGVKQVMILGAGFDTRALRLEFLRSISVIEIDHPNTSNFKTETFVKKIGKLPANVTYCQIDFNRQGLDELATQYHYVFTKPTTIIWEGVTNYLTEEAIHNTFDFIKKFSIGSYVIFTYVHKQALHNPESFLGGEKLLADLEKLQEQWTFGWFPEQLPGYLNQFQLTLIEDAGAEAYRKKYLPKRSAKGYEFYRVAIAKK